MLTLFFLLTYGATADASRAQLADKMIRLHVIANSNDSADQALKLKVRDRVLGITAPLLDEVNDAQEMRKVLRENMQTVVNEAQQEVYDNGYAYPVTACIENEFFPTKAYDGFSLPAGEYNGLKIRIGEAKGKNWWCVVFPPLCLSASSGKSLTEQTGLSAGEADFIQENGTKYVVKFKTAELFGQIRHAF